MTLTQLKYIIETAKAGTISRAAEKLYISQPSLTAAIRELEHEFGITIFQRTNKGIILTSEGEEFLGYARQVITQTSLMEERYSGATPVRHQFCVSTQHYSFAVEAFVELLKTYGGKTYDFRLRETQTYEIIEDVAKLKSEIGVLYLNQFNENVLRKTFKASCVCRIGKSACQAGKDHSAGSGAISEAFLRAGRSQCVLFFRGDFKYAGEPERHPGL